MPLGYWMGISQPPEIYHGGAGLHMDVVELGAFEFAHEMILLLFFMAA